MTSVNALAGTNGSTGTTGTSGISGNTGSTTSTAPNDQMGKDTFLKLLVAQLQYQDPSNPADATQFIAQTAQFTVVEKLGDLSTLEQNLLTATQAQSAASLVGRTVTWVDGAGKSHTGPVSAANLGSPPTLTVGDQTVDLSAVTAVTAGPTPTASPTPTA